MKKKLALQISAWLPVILWALLIFRFSDGQVPVASVIYWQDFAVKKTGHVILFGVMALFVYRALRINNVNRRTAAIYAVILSTFYGATDEYHQMFTQGREARVRDVFIDGLGALLAASVLYYLPVRLSAKFKNMLDKVGVT